MQELKAAVSFYIRIVSDLKSMKMLPVMHMLDIIMCQ